MLISEAFERFRRDHIVYRNQSAKTEEMNRLACRSLLSYTGDIHIEDLTFDLVRKWKEHLEKTRSPNTVRGYVIKLRVVLKHLAQHGYKNIINAEAIGVPRRKSVVVNFLTPEEVSEFINAAIRPAAGYSKLNRMKNAAIISIFYASGLRVSELCNLNRDIIKADSDSFTVIGKGNKPRLCFLDERSIYYATQYINMRKDKNPALFVGYYGDRITKDSIAMMFRHNSKRSGITAHPHMMRHSFATNLLRNNTNLLYVSKFLGHSSVQTTEMYTHVVDEDLRSIYKEKHSF